MMFNIKIKHMKLLHSYPDIQLCKKQMLDVYSHAHTCTHTHSHTKVYTEKAGYLQHKMANVQRKTHQTKCEVDLL